MSKPFSLFVYLECSPATHSQHSVSLEGLVREASCQRTGRPAQESPRVQPHLGPWASLPDASLAPVSGLLGEHSIAKASRMELLLFKHILY